MCHPLVIGPRWRDPDEPITGAAVQKHNCFSIKDSGLPPVVGYAPGLAGSAVVRGSAYQLGFTPTQFNSMNRTEAREAVESLQNLLIGRATGGGGNDVDYRELRDSLRGDDELKDLLPTFVRTARDLSQFWAYIQKLGGYQERREHIWTAFSPLLEYLEGDPPASQPARPIAAPVTTEPRMRAFISYSTEDKAAAGAVKRALSTYNIDCFLAHEDIHVSEEWRERILEELTACHVFIPLLSQAFKRSGTTRDRGCRASIGRSDCATVPR